MYGMQPFFGAPSDAGRAPLAPYVRARKNVAGTVSRAFSAGTKLKITHGARCMVQGGQRAAIIFTLSRPVLVYHYFFGSSRGRNRRRDPLH